MTAIGERQVAEGRSKRHTMHADGPGMARAGAGGGGGGPDQQQQHQGVEGRHSRGHQSYDPNAAQMHSAPEPTNQMVLEATREHQDPSGGQR